MNPVLNRRRRRKLEVNIVPLVDVFTVLIFFFLLTMHFKDVRSADINLPTMSSAERSTQSEKPVAISISKEGEIYFGEKKLDANSLEGELKNFAEKNPQTPLVILADKDSKIENFAEVFDKARIAKIKKLVFQTSQNAQKK